jgi:hypothetical protein
MTSDALNKELLQLSSLEEYKKLFGTFIPKDSLSFLTENADIDSSSEVFSKWMTGERANSLAIIGNEGCGCAIAQEKLLQLYGQHCKVLTVNLGRYAIANDGIAGTLGEAMGAGRSADMDDLLKVINENDKKVIFLENCHNLFVRKVGGFDALFDLHHLLSFSRAKVFWVTRWSPFAWYYLDKTIGFNDFFDKIIHFKAIESPAIIKWLQERHDTTGFTASFVENDGTPSRTANSWLPSGHQAAMVKGASGNIETACGLWLKSLSSNEPKEIVVTPPIAFDEATLNNLSEEELYFLCSLLFHEEISLDYLAEDMNLTELETRMKIDFLRNKDIVIAGSERTTFTISPTALPSILKILAKKNLINMEDLGGY